MEINVNKRKYFTQDKKNQIIKEHQFDGISIPVLARKYGVHAITLYNWKRKMKQKTNESLITPEYIQKLIEENDLLKKEVHNLKAKVGDLSIKNDILKDGIDIIQKKVALKELGQQKKSKRLIGMK